MAGGIAESCKRQQKESQAAGTDSITVSIDSIPFDTIRTDTVTIPVPKWDTGAEIVITDTVFPPAPCTEEEKLIDTLRAQVFKLKYDIEKIKFYVRICMRNPSQRQFLLGWVRRVVEQ